MDLSQARNHARVISRLLLCLAAAAAFLNPPPLAAQLTPSAESPPPRAPAKSFADQPVQIVISVRLNGVAKGDFVAYLTAGRDFLLLPRDLVAMGVPKPPGRLVDIAGEPHLSLQSIAGAELKFNEKTLTLDIQLPPDMLPSQSLNLGATQPATTISPRAPGGFLNYQLGRTLTQSGFETYNGATELGLNVGKFLLLDNRVYTTSSGQNRAVRLQTQLVYDQPEELRRWTLGDGIAASGELGSSFNFGGIGVSKLFQINPYFVKSPLAGYAGAVTLPSTVDVYMNGARVQSQSLAPGNFNLQNLDNRGATGLNNLEIVIRDPFGREQRVSFPYFFSDQLLAKGLDEYSYNVGVIRRNFGVSSSDYGTPAVSAFHRYGVSNTLTVGLNGDATPDHINIGPRASLNTGNAGVVTVGLAVSHDSDVTPRSGAAASVNHSFLSGRFSSQILVRRFTEDFTVIGFAPTDKPKLQGSAGVSYGAGNTGTFSLGYSSQTVFGGAADQRTTTLGYSRTLARNLSIVANVSRIVTGTSGYAAFFGVTYFPGSGMTVNASHQKTKNGDTSDQLQFSKTPPIGEGVGYRVIAQRSVTTGTVSESISPFVQYNARAAVLTAEGTNFVNGGSGSSGFYRVSIAGAAAYIGNDVYFSRPINDSFALVKIEPPLAGVRVLKSSAEIGVTDATGTVFVPNLGSYQVNEIAVQPKDIPLDYTVSKSGQKIRPPLRSGVLATFDILRIRAVTGRLKYRSDGAVIALENYEMVLTGKTATARVSTIRGGDFYVENLVPGHYSAQLNVDKKSCKLEVTIPDSNEIVTDLGDIYCEPIP